MPFFLRKSFRAGPLRLNLSKSGFGISAGVTGARVGVSSRGEVYTHAGRYGLYHRQTLGRVGGGGTRRASPAAQREIVVDTGVTYGRPVEEEPALDPVLEEVVTHEVARSGGTLRLVGTVVALVGVVLTAVGGGGGSPDSGPSRVSLLFAVALVAIGVLLLTRGASLGRRASALRRFEDELARAVLLDDEAATTRARRAVRAMVERQEVGTEAAAAVARRVYLSASVQAVADQVLDARESQSLAWLTDRFRIDEAFRRRAHARAVRVALVQMVSDHHFDADEEERFEELARCFDLDPDALQEERAMAAELARLRDLRERPLVAVATTVPLRRGESCYFEAPARLLTEKVLRRFTRDGVRHAVRGFEVRSEGSLLITDRRILVVHAGSTSIPLDRVLEVELDVDRNLLTLTRDGVQRPTWITSPDAEAAVVVLDRLLETQVSAA